MACNSCSPNRSSIEFIRRFKPENNTGCCCGGHSNDCNKPSLAREDSALWQWEQIHGRLITTVTSIQDESGHTVQVVKKTVCPLKTTETRRKACCSFGYRILR